MKQDDKTPLHEPEQAVDDYLATLLSEVDGYQAEPESSHPPPSSGKPDTPKASDNRAPQVKRSQQPDAGPERRHVAEIVEFPGRVIMPAVVPEEEIPTGIAAAAEAEIQSSETQTTKVASESADQTESGSAFSPPDWAAVPFQVLMFKVRGMNLAIPLLELDSIARWTEETTQLPGQPDWHLGVYTHRGDQVIVVDTAQLIMPERLGPVNGTRLRGSHLLMIGGGRWGLACDQLSHPLTLSVDQVNWSRSQPRRPWMMGTVIDKLCIMLSAEGLLKTIRHE